MNRKQLSASWGIGTPYEQSVRNFRLRENEGLNNPQYTYTGDSESRDAYLDKQDDDYGITDWAKDTWSEFFQDMNKAQADDMAGQWQRAQEKIDIAKGAAEEIKNDMKIDALNSYFSHRRKGLNTAGDIKALQQLYPNIDFNDKSFEKKLLSESDNLILNKNHNNYDLLIKDMQSGGMGVLADLKHKLGIWIHDNNDDESNSIAGYMQDWVGDRVTDASGKLAGIDGVSNKEKLQMLQDYQKQLSDVQKYSKRAQEANEKESKWYENAHKVSEYYKNRIERSQRNIQNGGSMWTIDNLLYANTQQMGFSSSSWDKLGASMLLSIAAGVATGGTSTAMQVTGAGLGVAGAMAQYSAGQSENNAQAIEDLKTRVTNQLKKDGLYDKVVKEGKKSYKDKSDDEIMDMIAHGDYLPQNSKSLHSVSKAITGSLEKSRAGINANFERNQYAVASDAMVDMLLFSGKGFNAIGSAIAKATNTAAKFAPIKQAGKWVMDRIGNGVGRAYKFGVKTGTGIGGGIAAAGVRATGNIIDSALRSTPKEGLIRNAMAWSEREVNAGRKMFGKLIAKTHAKDAAKDLILQKRLDKFVKKPAGFLSKVAVSGYSETIEEGKQYLNGQQWIENEDPERVIGFFDGVMRDMQYGSKLIVPALGVPFGARWGIADKGELYANMAGGWLGGAMHTAIVSGAADAIGMMTTPDKISVAQAIAQNYELGRANAISRFTKGSNLVEIAHNDPNQTKTQLEYLKQFNQNRRKLGFSNIDDQTLNEEEEYIDKLTRNAKNPILNDALDDADIQKGTREWFDAISAYTMYNELSKEDESAMKEVQKQLPSAIQDVANVEVDDEDAVLNSTVGTTVNPLVSIVNSVNAKQEAKRIKDRTEAEKQNIIAAEHGDEEAKKTIDTQQEEDAEAALNASVASEKKGVVAPTLTINDAIGYIGELKALQELKDDITVADDYSEKNSHHDATFFKNKIQERIDQLKKKLDVDPVQLQKVLDDPTAYIANTEKFEDLKSLYKKQISAKINRDVSDAFIKMLTGQPNFEVDKETKKLIQKGWHLSKAKDLIKKLNNAANSDYDTIDRLNNEYEQSVNGTSAVQQAAQAQQPQQSTAPSVVSAPIQTNATVSVVDNQVASATAQLDQMLEESIQYDYELSPDNIIDPELDKIGSVLMNAAFVNGKYSWKDAVAFVYDQLKKYNFSDRKISMAIPFLKQWYMAEQMLSIYDNIDQFSPRSEVIATTAQDIIDDLTFDYDEWIERKKKELGVNFIVPSIEVAVGTGGILDAQYKKGDTFGIIYDNEVVVYTVTKVDKDGNALDIDDEFGNPLCRDGNFLTKEQLELLKTGFTPEQNTISKHIEDTLSDYDSNIEDSTSHDLFVRESDGKLHLYTRSFYVTGEQFEEEASKTSARNTAYNKILDSLRNNDMESLNDITITFEQRHNQYATPDEYVVTRKLSDLKDLKKYLNYLDQFDSNTDDQYVEVAEALSNLLVEDEVNPSLVVSQIVIELAKHLFDTNVSTIQSVDYNTFQAEAFGNKYNINAFIPKSKYDELVTDLKSLADYYQNTLHYKVMSLDHTLYSKIIDQNGKEHRVSGQNAFVAIDQFGKTHLLNLASSSYTFIKELSGNKVGPMFDPNRKLFNKYESKRSSIDQYGMKMSLQAQLFCSMVQNVELADHPIELIPIHLKYNYKAVSYNYNNPTDTTRPGIEEIYIGKHSEPLRVILPTTSNIFDQIQFYEDLYDDIFPRIDERCNLLTTIKEELQTVLYNINSLKNSNNQQTLNKVAALEQRVTEYISRIDDCINTAYEVCNTQQLDTVNLMISTMFDNLDDVNALLTQTQIEDVQNSLSSEGLTEEDEQFAPINKLMQDIANRYKTWVNDQSDRQAGQKIWQDCNELLNLVQEFKDKYPNSKYSTECTRAEQMYLHIKNLQPVSSIHNMRASRIRDGYGFTNYNTVELYYQQKAVATDGSGITLSEVCGEPEFAEQSVTFISGRPFRSKAGKPGTLIPITIEYKGKTFNVMLRLADNQHGQSLMMKISNLLNTKKQDERIVLTGMDRTLGRPNNTNHFVNVTNSMLVPSDINYSDIKMDTTMKDGERSFTIGLTKHYIPSNPNTPVVIVDREGQVQYTFPKVIDTAGQVDNGGTAGKLYVVMTPDYRNKSMIPEPMVIPIQNMNYNDDEVNYLISLFRQGMNDKVKLPRQDGLYVQTDLTYKDLISMFIPYGKWRKDKPATRVMVSGAKVTFTFGQDNQQTPGMKEFDMNSNDPEFGLPGLVKYLKTQRFHISKELLYAETADKDNKVFRTIKTFFKDNKGEQKVRFGNTRMQFDKSDFENGGMSGLAWMMKHEMLMTDVDKFVDPRFSYNDVSVESDPTVTAPVSTPAPVETNDSFDNIDYTEFIQDNTPEFYDNSLHIAIDGEEAVNKEEAELHIEQIFGKNVKKEVVDNYVRIIRDFPPGYAGRCFRDMIYVSTRAVKGTEYHEAFHRVYRLLLTEKQRNKLDKSILKIYEKKYGKEAAKIATRKDLNEFAADKCQRYFVHHGNVEFSIRGIFDFIKDCYKAYKQIGSLRLYWLFMQMNRGKFVDKETLEENRDALSTIADDARGPLTIHGKSFKHVVSKRQYNTLLRSLYYYINIGFGIKEDLSNIDDLNLTKEELLKKRTIKFKARWSRHKNAKYNLTGYENFLKKKYPDGKLPNGNNYVVPEEDSVVTRPNPKTGIIEDVYDEVEASIADLIFKKCTTPDALQEMIDKFDEVVKYDLIRYLKDLGINYKTEADHTYEKMMRAGDIALDEDERGWLDVLLKDTFEQSQVSRAQSSIKRLMSLIKEYKLNDHGKYVPVRNECGLFEYMDHKDVLNMVFSDCMRIKTPEEMMAVFERKKNEGNHIYRQIYETIYPFYKHQNNANNEQIVTQLFNLVASTQNKFKTLLAHREGKGENAYYVHTVKDCGQEYEAREFKKTWGRMLFYSNNGIFRKNEDGNFVPVDNESISKIGKVFDALQSIKEFFNDKNIRAVTEAYEDVPVLTLNIEHLGIKDHYINMDNDNDLNILKKDVCLMLNSIGIQLSYNELEFMLSKKYGEHNTILDNLNKFFNQTGDSDIANLWQNASDLTLLKKTDSGWDINFKDNVITSNKGRKIPVEDVYDHNAFIGEIANYKYQYRHKFEDMAVLVTNNKRYYTISENNLITDVTDEISKYGQVAKDLSKYCFNVYKDENGNLSGSLILKEADNCHKLGKQLDINVCTLTQFKTDETKNEGHDYFDISEVEDYLAKSTILRDGHIIFPTMSDKKTWVYIDGVILPGLKYSNVWNAKENKNELVVEQQFDVAIDQLIEYAFAEYKSVNQTIKQVNDLAKNHPERMVLNFHTNFVTSKSYSTLEQALKVDSNVHYITDSDVEMIKAKFDKNNGKEDDGNVTVPLRNNQVKVSKKWDEDSEKYKYSISYNVPNGCMFGSFNGIHTKDGYVNFNTVFDKEGRFISPEKNLQKAEKLFFGDHISNQTLADADGNKIEGRRDIIRRAISEQTDEELEHVVELGLITYDESTGLYANRGLDNESLKAVDRMLGHDAFNPEVSMSNAIRTYIADTVIKSIMSINEVERVYAGNPAFFKFKYDVDEEGNTVLMNRSVDEFKRLGGLISTGVNNNLSIKGIPSDGMYNCAIINDVEVSSKQMDTIDRLMGEAEWRSAYKALTKTKFEEPKYDPELTPEQNEEIYQSYREYVKDSNNKKDDDSNSMSLDDIKDYIKKYHEQTYDIIVAKIKAETKSYHGGINVADGAAYISPEMTEWLLRMCGNYDKKVQKAFEILKNPKSNIYSQAKAYKLVTTKVIGAQKYTAYGQRLSEDGKTMIPYYNKMALFPVFKCIATGEFSKIYDKMQNNVDQNGNPAPVHMLMMESAVKIGAQGVNSWSTDDSFKFNTFKQSFKYLRKQFNTDPHHQEDQAMGTQMVKVALASLLENHKYITENGEELRGYELLDQIMNDINSLARDGYQNIEQDFFKEDGTLDIVKFSQFLHDNLTSRDSDQSLIESIETVARISPDGTKYYTMNHPLAATSRVAWLQSILASRINEKVVDVNTKGSAFYQRSIFGMEGATIISDENAPKDLNGGKELKMIIEDGPAKGAMDCVLTIDYFADILKKAGLENASFEEQKRALMQSNIVGPNAKASLIGYRIPTQAQSSIHALRCVDVLPVIQHTIILPKEFTKITGSDFDIDKIFIGSLDYDVDESELAMFHSVADPGHAKVFTEKEDTKNRLIKNYLTILKDESSTHIAHRSIDNDTTLLTDLLKKIESKQVAKKPYRVYDFYSLRTQTKTKNEFITGKTGIGPFALNNNSQILTMLYGVEFAKNTIMDRLGHASLHRTSDDYGNSIMSWISALINAHVDIAKDPYITRLNVNPMTYNLVNLMIRTGYGDDTFYFTTQPIMKKMAEKYTQSSSEFMKDPNKSVYEIRKECKRNAALEVCGEEEIEWAEELLLDERGNLKLEYDRGSSIPRVDASQVINSLFSNKILEKISINGIVEDDAIYQIDMPDGTPQMITGKKVQALVYVIDKLFETPAQKLADVVKYSKIDTKKQGKNITEQLAYARGVEKTFGDMTLMKEIYGEYVPNEDEVQNLDNFYFNRGLTYMYEKSFIKAKTHLAIGLYSRILKDQVIEAAPAFQRLVSRIASLLNSEGDKDISKISQAVSDKLKSEYFIQYAKDNNIDIQGLVTGENTIYDRLLSIQYKITSGQFGQEMIDTDGTPSNTLLKLLIADNNTVYNPNSATNNNQRVDRFKNLKFVRLFNALDLDSAKTDAIIQAWEDLLEDPNDEIRTFARDLCVYAFFTSGDKGGRTKLFQYVPNKFRTNFDTENSYVNFIRDLLVKLQSQAWCESMLNSPNFIDDIALNNYTDNTFVKQYKLTEEDTSEGSPIKWIKLDTLDSVRQQHPDVDQTHYPVLVSTQDYINKEDAPMYFKTYRSKYKDSFHRCVTVYKRIGFKEAEGNPDMIIPIYAKVNPRGYTTGGYNFYEYGDVYQSNPDPEFAIDVNKWAKFPLDYKIAAYTSNLLEKFLTMIRTFRGGTSVERRTSGLDGVYAPVQPTKTDSSKHFATKRDMLNAMYKDGDAFAGEVSSSPYTKQGDKFVLKDDTDVKRALKAIAKRGVPKSRRDSLLSKESIQFLTDGKDDTTYYNVGYNSGDPTVIAVTNRELFDEGYTPKTIMYLREDSRLSEKVISQQVEQFKGSSTFLVSAEDTIAIDFFKTNGYKYEVYSYGDTNVQPVQSVTTSTNNTPDVNIHYGSNENQNLSNFADRPFAFTSVFDFNFSTMFKTVEGAFQAQKLNFTDYYDIEQKEDLEKEFSNATGEQARSKGRSIKGLDRETWDEQSSSIMKQLLLESFKQNPQALKALLATGDAKLTHLSKDQQKMTPEQLEEAKRKYKWIEEFPRLLMEVRSELKDYKSEQKYYEENGSPIVMYRGYAMTEDRFATSIEETIGHTAVDYDDTLKGAIYFTSDEEEALDYAKSRTDKSEEEFVRDGKVIKQRNRHYTGDYAKVGRYFIAPNAKVEHYADIRDYIKNGQQSTADVIILDQGTLHGGNTEYVVRNKSVIISDPEQKNPEQPSPSSTDTIFGADGLTDEQRNAKDNTLDYILKTINGKQEANKPYALIQGKAGTGKTFVVQYIIKELKKKHPGLRIAVAALSRKAVHVLADKTASLGAKTESLYTLAGANPSVGEDRFAIDPEKQRFSKYDVIFIDECSMITPGFQDTIDQYKMDNPDLAIVFLGDKGQLRGVDTKKSVTKAPIFERDTVVKSELNTRIRQGEDSPILSYADPYWEVSMGNSNQDVNKIDSGFNTVISENGSVIFESGRQVIRKAIPAFKEAVYSKNPNHIKIVAGKNETVDMYNEAIHNALFPDAEGQFTEGDLVIYNQPYGGKEGVENSTEGIVTHVSDVKVEYTNYGELRYRTVQVKVDGGTMPTLVLDKNDIQSKNVFSKIVDEAYQYALRLRTKGAWKHYYDTKDRFADLKYAYSITTHKSQGSTYDITVVDGMDISSMPWSQQQIAEAMYTAITRSKDTTVMISRNKKSDINVEEYANDMTKVKNEPISPSDPRTDENASYSKYGKLTGWKDKTTYTAAQAREAYSKMPNRFDKLADWAFTAAEKLGITYIVDNGIKTSEGRTVAGSSDRTAPVIYLNLEGLRAGTLLHETIHATTRYWIDNFENAPIKIKKALSYLKSSYDEILEQYIIDTVAGYDRLSKDKKNSVRKQMQKYYASVAGDVYGLSNFYEFIAEMSNHKLVALIQQMDADQEKKKNILQRIVEGIMRILHLTAAPEVKNESIMRNIAVSLQYVITNVDTNKYQDNIQRWRDILDGNSEEGQNPLFDNQVVKNSALEQLQKVENGERIGTEYDAATLLRSMSLATQINGVLTTSKTIEVSMFNTFFSQSKNEERTIEYKRRQPVESITEEQLNAVLYNHGMAHITTNIDRAGRITFVSNQNDTYTTDSIKDMLNKDYDDNIQGKC